jgi:hypothetical protein
MNISLFVKRIISALEGFEVSDPPATPADIPRSAPNRLAHLW